MGAITRWLAHQAQTPVPGGAQRAKRSVPAVFLAEMLHPVGERLQELIRRETSPEMA